MKRSTPGGPQTPNPGPRATQRAQLAPVGIPRSQALACQRQPRDPPLAFSLASAYVPVEMVVPEAERAGWAEPAPVATNNARRRARPPRHNPRTRDTGHRRITTEYSVYGRTSQSNMSWNRMSRRAGRPAAGDRAEATANTKDKTPPCNSDFASTPQEDQQIWDLLQNPGLRRSPSLADPGSMRASKHSRSGVQFEALLYSAGIACPGGLADRQPGTGQRRRRRRSPRHMRKTRPRPIKCKIIIKTGSRYWRTMCSAAWAGSSASLARLVLAVRVCRPRARKRVPNPDSLAPTASDWVRQPRPDSF